MVHFDANGGSVSRESVIVKYGEKISYGTNGSNGISTLPVPTRVGYRFLGWYKTNAVNTNQQVSTTDIEVNTTNFTIDFPTYQGTTTLYAQWEACDVTVTFKGNGGDVDATSLTVTVAGDTTKAYTYGQTFGSLPTATRPGYDFVGWYTVDDKKVEDDTLCSKTKISKITWSDEGYGWPIDGTCAEMTLTLKAKWVEHTYTIILHSGNDGYFDNTPSKKTKAVNVTYKQTYGQMIPVDNSDDSDWESWYGVYSSTKSFDGWFAGDENESTFSAEKKETTTFEGNEIAVEHLWARWGASCEVYANGGALTSDCNGSIQPKGASDDFDYKFTIYNGQPLNTKLGDCDALTTSISRIGYTFAGWYWDADCTSGHEVDFTTNPVGDKIYAKWNPRQVNVTFNGNKPDGGSTTPSSTSGITVSYDSLFGTTLGNVTDPTCVGYTFAGWWTTADNTGFQVTTLSTCNKETFGNLLTLPEGNAAGTSSLTLYAHWTVRTVQVTFNGNKPNGGSTTPSSTSGITVSYDSQFGTTLGWYSQIQ